MNPRRPSDGPGERTSAVIRSLRLPGEELTDGRGRHAVRRTGRTVPPLQIMDWCSEQVELMEVMEVMEVTGGTRGGTGRHRGVVQ
jgi:hypothetical protein